jgi:hypothetical protein
LLLSRGLRILAWLLSGACVLLAGCASADPATAVSESPGVLERARARDRACGWRFYLGPKDGTLQFAGPGRDTASVHLEAAPDAAAVTADGRFGVTCENLEGRGNDTILLTSWSLDVRAGRASVLWKTTLRGHCLSVASAPSGTGAAVLMGVAEDPARRVSAFRSGVMQGEPLGARGLALSPYAWSPDGSRFAYVAEDGSIATSTGSGMTRVPNTRPASAPLWSRDGWIYFGSRDGSDRFMRIREDGSEARQVARWPGGFLDPVLSPDLRFLLVRRATGGSHGETRVVEVASGESSAMHATETGAVVLGWIGDPDCP